MGKQKAANGPIAYREYGDGMGKEDPVVLLHAFPLNSRMWRPQAEALAKSRRVVTPDYPGFGRSLRTPAQPDVHYYAECVRDLMDHLGLDQVVLGGISMGGYVAFACMKLFPERISGLILANTRPDPDSGEARETRKDMARRVTEEGVEVLIELQMQRLLAPATLKNNEQVVEEVRSIILESSSAGVIAALAALRERPDSTPLLGEIKVPTLVIGGAEDGISSPEVMDAMAQEIPASRHVVLENAGHLSNLEAPEEFNSALNEFLSKVPSKK